MLCFNTTAYTVDIVKKKSHKSELITAVLIIFMYKENYLYDTEIWDSLRSTITWNQCKFDTSIGVVCRWSVSRRKVLSSEHSAQCKRIFSYFAKQKKN